jgi:hypothetical protein
LQGIGADRSLLIVPRAGQYGWSEITVEAEDPEGLVGRQTFEVLVNQTSAPPIIVVQPESQVVARGTLVQLRVVATGDAPMEYQWEKGGVALSGETSAILDLGPATLEDSGEYRVRVQNTAGATNSVLVSIQVYEAPRIVQLTPQTTGVMQLTFTTVANQFYTVQYRDALDSGTWQVLTTVNGTGEVVPVVDRGAVGHTRFYRIRTDLLLP